MREFDCAIMGGGPAGAAAAITLANLGVTVLLCDARLSPVFKIGETLSPSAKPCLQSLGVLDTFTEQIAVPSHGNLSAWGSPELIATDFLFNPFGHGWQVDRPVFESHLHATALLAGAELLNGHSLAQMPRDTGERWEFKLSSAGGGGTFRARWLVDATGRRRALGRFLNTTEWVLDKLVCVYASAHIAEEHGPNDQDSRTLIESSRDGWWYTALIPGGRRTVAYLTDADCLSSNEWRDKNWFAAQCQALRYVPDVLLKHHYLLSGALHKTAANSSRIELFAGTRWLAAGDAAASYDPLSSQGLLCALFTGRQAGLAIHQALSGDASAAGRYAELLNTIWAEYLSEYLFYYSKEKRWKENRFWKRRTTDSDLRSPITSRKNIQYISGSL